jgi:hypothetical protein
MSAKPRPFIRLDAETFFILSGAAATADNFQLVRAL